MTTTEKAEETGGVVLAVFLLSVAASFYFAYVILLGWRWFAVPLLGAPALSYWGVFGLWTLLVLLRGSNLRKPEDEPTASRILTVGLLRVFLAHLFFWIAASAGGFR